MVNGKSGMIYDPDMRALLKALRASARSPADSINIMRGKGDAGQVATPNKTPGHQPAGTEGDSSDD